ncbi:unnamed protein product [Adineta ricciae]|uniref:Uncharacterized protein n=1 Tax=Adineta ricciae TaxID=249248 RepID=A0A816AJ15_ADIRI|nr:unnamed protein product [Adineta ricciae]
MDGDGYKQIDSLVEIVDVKQQSSVIHLKVNVDVEGSERRPSSLNESDERISAGSEASTASRNGTYEDQFFSPEFLENPVPPYGKIVSIWIHPAGKG